jgi:lipopolysaccharide transport system ATP-binding protein
MSNLAIRAENIGKLYRIGQLEAYRTLRDSLGRALVAPIRRLRGGASGPRREQETIWALKDLSFDVAPGEVVGIIGRNGAGKTTLMKVLARITQPTEGKATIHGSVGSLLEVGTGFHPELTGRENVYLNGAILGMRRSEIDRKFDEIVSFAGIETFIDTPIKRYSSGMQVRLAFSVAAHFEPEILLVDEVLAVGDAEFQQKCLGRMEEVGAEGRTVLFISHSMPAVLRLCPRVILLEGGRMVTDGPARDVIRTYLESGLGTTAAREWPNPTEAPGDDAARLKAVRVLDESGCVSEEVDISRPVDIEVEYWVWRTVSRQGPNAALSFWNDDGVVLFATLDAGEGAPAPDHLPAVVRSRCRIPGNLLAEGQILVRAVLVSQRPTVFHAMERDAVAFHVVDRTPGDPTKSLMTSRWPGVIRPRLEWHSEYSPGIEAR